MGTKSVFPQVGGLITLMMKGFITLMMKGFITSSQLVDSGAVMVKWAFPGERPHRRRSALAVMDRYGDTVGGLLLISSRFGVTPSPAVKRRCGIRLDPGGHRHAGAGAGLYVLARPPAVP
jgi:hypothetical protein